ncbi:MAG: hypothetical protein EU530_08620, partial [Promethearchaeota archaeon]
MSQRLRKPDNSHNKLFKLTFIAVFIFISLSTASIPLSHEKKISESTIYIPDGPFNAPKSSNLFEDGILYTGTQDALVINETAIFSNSEHFEIGNGTHAGITSQNAEFPIDATHDWEGFYYNATISNIVDERDWIENGNIGSNTGLIYSSQISQSEDSGPSYGKNLNPATILATFDGTDCDYMRIHFVLLEVEYYWDALYISDQDDTIIDYYAGYYTDFYTPWYSATELKISMDSDNTVELYGYSVDYFETYNGSMFTIDSSDWTYFEDTITDASRLYGSTAEQSNHSALGVVIEGIDSAPSYSYEDGDIAGFYQDFTVPRGEVTDAWVSMDYNLLRGINTNDNYAFIKINGETVYTRGFRTISGAGLGQWHSTGLIDLILWENSSNIFNDVVYGQSFNLSVGIEIGNGVEYTGFDHLDIQEAYFDNIQLILKTRANTTQADINLEFDGLSLIDSTTEWGSAFFSRYNTWDSNPMQISMTADAPKLEFDLYSNVYGYHVGSSYEQHNGQPGSKLTILTNETILWESYHNVFIPSQYTDYKYDLSKPNNWEIIQVNDPVGVPYTSYIGGGVGDDNITIESNFPGWWYFLANSSNRILSSSTELYDDSTWRAYDIGGISYDVGEDIEIRTALSNPSQIGNLLASWANVSIYYPNETLYHSESIHPNGLGNIEFTAKNIEAIDTVGGVYQYSLIWTNGSSAGGLNGTFEIKHNIQHTLLYPRNAIIDFETEAILGDIIPVRLKLNDSANGINLNNLHVEYNWTTGNATLNEISSGIYDTSLDTLDLTGVGEYTVEFTISGLGFYDVYFTLELHLTSETELKIIGLDNNIDYGTNFSIRLDYHTKPGSIGISQAQISLNLSDYYVTEDVVPGQYNIEINSTESFPSSGIYDIQINSTCVNYQSQELITRIQILPRSIYFQILINSADCSSNKSYSAKIQEDLNFTIGVYTSSSDQPVITGTVQLSDGASYSTPFTIEGERYFNLIDSSFFGLGVNFISIIFNETGYQSASEVLQISITRINFDIEFESGDTLLIAKRSEFTTRLYLADPRTSAPMLNAIISYSWIFGTGFLTEIGNGYYQFSETAPSQVGTYEIIFTVTPAESDYEIGTISMTLVSQQPDTPLQWWWIIASAGLVVAVLSGSLIAIGVKNKRTKNREQEITKLKHKTQIFDDITNIKGILLIEKQSGLLMYRHVISGLDEANEELFSGFIRAILLLGKRFIRDDEELEKGMVFEKQEFIEFAHENFKILLGGGHKIIVALILEKQASEELKLKTSKFIEEFEGIYASVLENWTGNRSIFTDTTPKLLEEIFKLSLLKNFHLSENSEIYAKKFITPNSISERVSNVI